MLQVDLNSYDFLEELNNHDSLFSGGIPDNKFSLTSSHCCPLSFWKWPTLLHSRTLAASSLFRLWAGLRDHSLLHKSDDIGGELHFNKHDTMLNLGRHSRIIWWALCHAFFYWSACLITEPVRRVVHLLKRTGLINCESSLLESDNQTWAVLVECAVSHRLTYKIRRLIWVHRTHFKILLTLMLEGGQAAGFLMRIP